MKNPVTQKLLKHAKSLNKLKAAELSFIEDYYQRLSGQDYSSERADHLIACARTHRTLAEKRRKGETLLRVETLDSSKDSDTVSIISIVTDDQPFLINSLIIALNEQNRSPLRTNHPNLLCKRDSKGKLISSESFRSIDNRSPDEERRNVEAFIQFEIETVSRELRKQLDSQLRSVIASIETVVSDWRLMRTKVVSLAAEVDSRRDGPAFAEHGELIRWMEQDHFAFMGYCEVSIKNGKPTVDAGSVLGLTREIWQSVSSNSNANRALLAFLPPLVASQTSPVVFTLSRQRSNIHRPGFMDCMLVELTPEDGKRGKAAARKVGVILGFLSTTAARLPTRQVPHIRSKVDYIVNESNLRRGGHAFKELSTILETLPRAMLLQLNSRQLYSLSMTLLNHQERRKTRVHLHQNLCGHFYTCLVYVPRDQFNSHLRQRIQDYLREKLGAEEVTFNVYFSESILTRIHFSAHLHAGQEDTSSRLNVREMEQAIHLIASDWFDSLVASVRGKQTGFDTAVLPSYRYAFPTSFRERTPDTQAIADIGVIESLQQGEIAAKLGQHNDAGSYSIRLFVAGDAIALSDILPRLENMGLRITAEHPYEVQPENRDPVWLHVFKVSRQDDQKIDLSLADDFEELLIRTRDGSNEDDGFNQLTLLAGLDWRQVGLFRAYFRYLKQIRLRYSENYVIEVLRTNISIVQSLNVLFESRFDPKRKSGFGKALSNTINKIEKVETLDEDRILRAYVDVITATVRTNFYQPDEHGDHKSYMSFKIRSGDVPRIPEPAPLFEIFVCSPRVEGVHLRGGKVARGGLRWSERPEDFRTEVLGLVKAQRVKNAVIVPVGSKGGFVAKQLPDADRQTVQKEVIACYQVFISSLLDLTDNLIRGRIKPPSNVVRHDEDDPYLVVAADKGTATFSDIANQISLDRNFWLGDAFASGGSVGYDHKKMGITARGAWESVKRHFRELGKNIQATDFTAIGIGDMGGDVFGNGMLLSKHTRLIAAFNHLHIFIDPEPDAAKSWAERKRLFDLPRSSWTDYNTKLISKGGGIFERSAKSIKLSREARKALSIDEDKLAPNDLINRILKADVELLWNGGIGTYVKASHESHSQAQDRANDSLRVDGNELQCKVIGEGGNLGMTQYGRIEFSECGGLCYTDAIDNSAGVDTSDHEVNIKILLGQVMSSGSISEKQRNTLLAKMEDEVADLVLANNYVQTETLSHETSFSSRRMPVQARAIQILDEQGLLRRDIEFLPDDATIAKRIKQQQWFTRPELAVLLSYSKMRLYQSLLDSSLCEDKHLRSVAHEYFPKVLAKKYSRQINAHRLNEEIICTQITNQMVGVMGPTFHLRMEDMTDRPPEVIVRSYIAASEILNTNSIVASIQKLDNKVAACVQMDMMEKVIDTLASAVRWLVRRKESEKDIPGIIKRYRSGYQTLSKKPRKKPEGMDKDGPWREAGVPGALCDAMSNLIQLRHAFDVVDVASGLNRSVQDIGPIHAGVSRAVDVRWIVDAIGSSPSENHWHERAKFSLVQRLRDALSSMTADVAKSSKGSSAEDKIENWLNSAGYQEYSRKLTQLKNDQLPDFAMLSVLVSELEQL
ncbi:MAG: NAD-glutamate dehydrogenase [Pseudomonadota bacterium]